MCCSLAFKLTAYCFRSQQHFIHINVDCFVLNPPQDPGGFLQADPQGIVVELVYQSLVVLFLFETGRIIASGVTKTNVIQFLPLNSWNGHMTGFLGLFNQKKKKKVVVKNYYLTWWDFTWAFLQLLPNEISLTFQWPFQQFVITGGLKNTLHQFYMIHRQIHWKELNQLKRMIYHITTDCEFYSTQKQYLAE